MNFFRKKQNVQIEIPKADPTEIDPKTMEDYLKRGYAYHARKDYDKADSDFRHVLSLDANSSEAHYALGLNLKAQGKNDEAVKSFQTALDFLHKMEGEDKVRALMLGRITKGHINLLTKGNWDLRKEFWQGEGS